jgi:hypothetical protein
MSNEMFIVSSEIYKLLTEHIRKGQCHDKNCCVKKLLKKLEL